MSAQTRRAQRAAYNRAAWAAADARMRDEIDAVAVPMNADAAARRAARQARRKARAARDTAWRAEAAAAKAAADSAARAAGRSTRSGRSGWVSSTDPRAAATWERARPERPTREQLRAANRAAWARLQLDRLEGRSAADAARLGRRGERRRARSRTHRAAQAARLARALQTGATR